MALGDRPQQIGRERALPPMEHDLIAMRTCVRMLEYRYNVTEYDPERPWIVLSSSRGQVALADHDSFYEWAQEHWPGAPLERPVDPWQLAPTWPG